MIKFLLLTSLSILYTVAFCQNHSINGHILDQQQKDIPFASIALHNLADSILVKADIAKESGKFSFTGLNNGVYFIKISAVGYATQTSQPITVTDADVDLPPLILISETKQLNEVKVTATKPLIEVKHDRLIFNIEGSINSTGSNALELLQKSPGVQVDRNENILVKGKTGVRIYIDGRPSQMSGKDLASVLRSMNSADIEAIEIITNPSAKYEAAGDLGIINIRLKKNLKIGTNGNASLGANFGITPKYDASITLNHRDKKVNIFGTYSHSQGNWHDRTLDDQIMNGTYYNKVWTGLYQDTTNNFKLGTDYFINSKNTLGINVNGRLSNQNGSGHSETQIGKIIDSPEAILYSRTSNPGKNKNLNANINYRWADTTGHELNIDADYGIYNSRHINYQPNRYEFTDGETPALERNFVIKTPVDITIKSLKADYEQPFKKGRLGYGFKISDVTSDNTFDFFNAVNDSEVRDTERSNRFKYTERVYSGYLNYNVPLHKKWDLQLGLRTERTKSLGHLTSYKQSDLNKVDTTYLNFFPSGALTFKASEHHNWNLNYSRRINRPNYQDLNPFEYRVDELVYSKGNPFLKPEYANNFKLTHVYKSKLTTSLGYWRTRFPVATLRIPYDSSRTYFIPENLDRAHGFSLDLSISTPITKWWDIYFNISGYHNLWKAALDNGIIVNNRTTAFTLNGQNTIKFKNNWSLQLSGWYNSPYRRIDYNRGMGMMDVGIQKKFWKENATVKVSYSDLLHTARGGHHSEYAGIATDIRFKFEARMLKISLNYRFGSKEIKGERDRKTSTQDELNRI